MNRIVLIGNGFDLAHKLKTSYQNFLDDYWENIIAKAVDQSHSRICFENDQIRFKTALPFDFPKVTFKELDKRLSKLNSGIVFKNRFFETICISHAINKWVDLEDEYYSVLKKLYSGEKVYHNNYDIEQFHKEFDEVKSLLSEYLTKVEKETYPQEIPEIFNNIRDKIYSNIEPKDINDIGLNILAERFTDQLLNEPGFSDSLLHDHTFRDRHIHENLLKRLGSNISKDSILKVLRDRYPENYLEFQASSTLLLSFNYTNTHSKYCYPKFGMNRSANEIAIHGSILKQNKNPIIFGYGDELDQDYKEIEKLNDNKFLQNIKSIKYSQMDNYKKLLNFINSDYFQVFIFGHSCGVSDRTMLNTIFEHDNCVSIKPYYFKPEWGNDNYEDLSINISRNFNDKTKMRDRLVNKSFCEELVSKP